MNKADLLDKVIIYWDQTTVPNPRAKQMFVELMLEGLDSLSDTQVEKLSKEWFPYD